MKFITAIIYLLMRFAGVLFSHVTKDLRKIGLRKWYVCTIIITRGIEAVNGITANREMLVFFVLYEMEFLINASSVTCRHKWWTFIFLIVVSFNYILLARTFQRKTKTGAIHGSFFFLSRQNETAKRAFNIALRQLQKIIYFQSTQTGSNLSTPKKDPKA